MFCAAGSEGAMRKAGYQPEREAMRTRGRGGYARVIAIIDTLGLMEPRGSRELQESEMEDKIKALLLVKGCLWDMVMKI
jgi:hypothetical protein